MSLLRPFVRCYSPECVQWVFRKLHRSLYLATLVLSRNAAGLTKPASRNGCGVRQLVLLEASS